MATHDTCTDAHRLCRDAKGEHHDNICTAIAHGHVVTYYCTRAAGHTGSHVACGSADHNYVAWSDADKTQTKPQNDK